MPKSGRLEYAERKQQRVEELIEAGDFTAFPDALRFVQSIEAHGFRLAAASSSKNANAMMQRIRLDHGRTLLDVFAANVCGRDLGHGKPHPEIFLVSAAEMACPRRHALWSRTRPWASRRQGVAA